MASIRRRRAIKLNSKHRYTARNSRKNNYRQAETVYVAPPAPQCNNSKQDECECRNDFGQQYNSKPSYNKYQQHNTKNSKSFLQKLIGDKFKNDDLILILLIGVLFLTRNNNDKSDTNLNNCPPSSDSSSRGGIFGTDIFSSVTGLLDRFSDNDLLLFALLYILL